MNNKLKEAIELVDKLLNFTVKVKVEKEL